MLYWLTVSGGFWLGGETALVHWHAGVSEMYPVKAEIMGLARCVLTGSLWVGILEEGQVEDLNN